MIIIFYSAKNPSLREERNGNDRNLPGKTWDVGALRDKAVVALLTSILFYDENTALVGSCCTIEKS